MKNILDDTFEDMDSTLSDLMEELLEYVDIENPIISVKYLNNDGSVTVSYTHLTLPTT